MTIKVAGVMRSSANDQNIVTKCPSQLTRLPSFIF